MTLSTRLRGATGPGALERGSIAWALLVSLMLVALSSIFAASVITTVHRSRASTDTMMLTQYTDAAVADAISTLNAGDNVPATRADAAAKCEKVAARNMCFRYWAMPVPGNAADPVRYDLVTHVWVDKGAMTEPAGGLHVRAEKLPLEVITYQTGTGLGPVLADGYVAYHPTPSGLFANAIHSFASTTLTGPSLKVRSYNSQTGESGTKNATVSSSGWLSFGYDTQADRTVLFGGASAAGDHTSRCTGEACVESGTRVITATYADPTEASVAWMRTASTTACSTTTTGDYVTSAHGGKLPAGTTCIDGSLIVDTATSTTSPLTTVYVNGVVEVQDSLNAPASGTLAAPGSLVIYSTGAAVSVTAPDESAVSAMVYAPLAACGTNPASDAHVSFFGSLVCGTVSLGGGWDQMYDEAAIADYVDPVPGSAKTFSPGIPSTIGADQFTVPSGWTAAVCPIPAPAGASGYLKLDEAVGGLARDSATGSMSAGWVNKASTGRTPGICDTAAFTKTGGAVYGSNSSTATYGMSIEYWGKDLASTTAVRVAGVKVAQDDLRHVTVTVGSAAVRIPFSVENPAAWHLFTVTVSAAGQVTLYVDGAAKGTAASGVAPSTLSGDLTLGDGPGTGAMDEVVYYAATADVPPLTAAQVADRWTFWTSPAPPGATVSTALAGVPFGAPGPLTNDASTAELLSVKWTKVTTGDFPTADPTVGYRVEYAATAAGPWTALATVPGTASTYTQTGPWHGLRSYRVCALYNGDAKCSTSSTVLTTQIAAAPTVTTDSTAGTTAVFSWTAPTYATGYDLQWRRNGGAWTLIAKGTSRTQTVGPTTAGSKIEVQVRSVNDAGSGAWSAIAVGQLSLPTPTAVTVDNIRGRSVTFDWDDVDGATGYTVYVDGVAYWNATPSTVVFPRAISSTASVQVVATNAYVTSAKSPATTLTMPLSQGALGFKFTTGPGTTNAGVDNRYANSLVSPSGRYVAYLGSNGAFMVYDLTAVTTAGHSVVAGTGSNVTFQSDGNLVLYSSAGAAQRQTGTYAKNAASVSMQDDGNLVVYTPSVTPLWALSWGTGQPAPGSSFMSVG